VALLISRSRSHSSARRRVPEALPAGVLLPLVALGTDGTIVLEDGSLVTVLECFPRNLDTFAAADEERSFAAFRRLAASLRRGQSLQFIVESERVDNRAHLAFMRRELMHTFGFDPAAVTGQEITERDEDVRWRWGIYKLVEDSVRRGSPEGRFVPVRRCYVVWRDRLDDEGALGGLRGVLPGWLPGSRRRLNGAAHPNGPLLGQAVYERSVQQHARLAAQAALTVQSVRGALLREGTVTVQLDGPAVLRYLKARLNPTPRAGTPGALGFEHDEALASPARVLSRFDSAIEHEEAVEAATALRAAVAASPLHFREDPFHGRIDEDLTRTLSLAGTPSSTHTFWVARLLDLPLPLTLSYHLHGLDRGAVQELAVREEHQAAREIERTGKKGKRDAEAGAAHAARSELVNRMQRDPHETLVDVSLQLCIRAPGPSPDAHALDRAMHAAREIVATATAGGVLVDGHGRQEALWLSTLPFCDDRARETLRVGVDNAADTIPVIGSGFGSPTGLPVLFSRSTGEVVSINPFDSEHKNATTVVTGTSGTGKTAFVNHLVAASVSVGAHAVVADRHGDFEFLASLISGSRVVRLGGEEGDAINPWDVPDPAAPSRQKVRFLLELHRVLLNRPLHKAEEKILAGAIRSTYRRCARRALTPRQGELQTVLETSLRVLQATREQRAAAGQRPLPSDELAHERLQTLVDELAEYAADGVYASVWDRPTSFTGDPPLLIFDYSGASKDLLPALVFTMMEHARRYTQRIDAQAQAEPRGGLFSGRSLFVLDEGHSWTKVPEAADEVQLLAREGRHWGLWFIAMSQDAEDYAGDAKAVLSNASLKFFFEQDESMLDFLRENVKLPRRVIELMTGLRSVKGQYAECVVVNGGRGIGVGRVIFGPLAYWAYTSEPICDRPKRLAALRACGGRAWPALDLLAADGVADSEVGPTR
jgi:hypothetical protein